MRKTERVCGLGEVQSSKGNSEFSKACAYAQAGIYAIGNLHATHSTSNLTTVILYKDLTVHVALASIDRTKANEEIMGEASLGRADSNLKGTEQLLIYFHYAPSIIILIAVVGGRE